jgi:hypothetical protein
MTAALRALATIAALAVIGSSGCGSGGTEPCQGLCGPGTVCSEGRCVPEPTSEPALAPADDPEPKRRRGRRGKRGDAADEPEGAAGDAPPLADDSRVPAYDPGKTFVLGEGSERLPDATINRTLKQLEPKLQQCIADAEQRGGEPLRGRVDYTFRIMPDGKVESVSAKAPKAMADAGVIPCVRLAVFRQRFPAYDGPPTGADSSFTVD